MRWFKDRFWQIVAVVASLSLFAWQIISSLGRRKAERRAAEEMVNAAEADEDRAQMEDRQEAEHEASEVHQNAVDEVRDDSMDLVDRMRKFGRRG